MRVTFLNTWGGGAIYNVFWPLYRLLAPWGAEWRLLRTGDHIDPTCELIHYNYFRNMPSRETRHKKGYTMPVTCSVHHLHPQHAAREVQFIQAAAPVAVHTPDPFCQRQLQQLGVHNVHVIPYTFDWTGFDVAPLPDEFVVGYLGCDYNTKRFDVIREGAALAGVTCEGIGRRTLNEEEDFIPQEAILEYYKSISCYVVASYNDGGPLPPQEALLMGRPVATTNVGMMPAVVKEGINGTFHDGSARGIAKAIDRVRASVNTMHDNIVAARALGTLLPTTLDVAPLWRTFFEEAVK